MRQRPRRSVIAAQAFGPDQSRARNGEPLATISPQPELAEEASTTVLWGEAYGAWANADSDGIASGYSRNIGGFLTGLDGIVADTWRLGVLAGCGNTSLDARTANASVDSYHIGLYGGTQRGALGLRLGTALSHNEIDTNRTAFFDGLADSHGAAYAAKTVQVFGELGYVLPTAYADFEPFAAVNHVHLKSGSFQEDGDISNLKGFARSSDLTTTTLGVRASHDLANSQTISISARGMLGWSHAFGDVTPGSRLALPADRRLPCKACWWHRIRPSLRPGLMSGSAKPPVLASPMPVLTSGAEQCSESGPDGTVLGSSLVARMFCCKAILRPSTSSG